MDDLLGMLRDFTNFGVASNLERLKDFVKDKGLWKDFRRSSTGEALLEIIANFFAMLKYQFVRAVQESYPTRAKVREHVLEGFKILNYSPTRRSNSSVGLTFSVESPHPEDIVIPRFTNVAHADSDLNFYSVEPYILQAGETSVTGDFAEGNIETITVTSQGTENLEVHIPSRDVAEGEIYVRVDGETWEEIDTLQRALRGTPEFESYEVRARTDETLDVVFGNGTLGRIPPTGAEIEIRYAVTEGPDGVVFSSDSITELQDTIRDVTGTDVSDLISVSNEDRAATGGAERQSLDEIKLLAPQVFRAGDRAVTQDNYIAIARNYPSVALANVVNERNANPPDSDYADVTEIYVVRDRGPDGRPQAVTTDFAIGSSLDATIEQPDPDSFLGYMKGRSVVGTVNDVFEADLAHYFVESDLFIDSSVTPSTLVADVKDALEENLLEENNVDLNIGIPIRQSGVQEVVDSFDRIDYHHTKLVNYARADITNASVTLGLDDFTLSGVDYKITPPFKKETIEVFDVNDNLIAYDDGQGNLVPAEGEDNFQSGTVDYVIPDDPDVWELTMEFTDAPGQAYTFHFKTNDPRDGKSLRDGDILVNDRQFAIYVPTRTNIGTEFV